VIPVRMSFARDVSTDRSIRRQRRRATPRRESSHALFDAPYTLHDPVEKLESGLLRALVAAARAKMAAFGVPSFIGKWRAGEDEAGNRYVIVAAR
jgi:hypothetical protein